VKISLGKEKGGNFEKLVIPASRKEESRKK
jgi:hypothetical protein